MTLAAFAVIYFVWGSTFLAIRVGVRELPPFFLAALRFLAAGSAIYLWTVLRGGRSPAAREWGSALLVSVLIFVMDYGLLFWAEQKVPSGPAAVMMATIPTFMALAEIVLLRTRNLTASLALALVIGLIGVAVLVSRSLSLGGAPIDTAGASALIVASLSWSVASALSRKLPLPKSRVLSSGTQMLCGGVLLLATSGLLGEFRSVHLADVSRRAWFALAYLTIPGSIIGFTAYTWLLQRMSPTKVGTYAYVNPVVAVVIGYFFAGEELGVRTLIGAACVLVSVVMITLPQGGK